MIRPGLILATMLFLTAATLPAQALMCYGQGDDAGVQIGFGFHIGEPYTETERNAFDVTRLRQAGVDATGVERWNGCIRAFVRKPGGGEEMQFFEPGSLRRVQ